MSILKIKEFMDKLKTGSEADAVYLHSDYKGMFIEFCWRKYRYSEFIPEYAVKKSSSADEIKFIEYLCAKAKKIMKQPVRIANE